MILAIDTSSDPGSWALSGEKNTNLEGSIEGRASSGITSSLAKMQRQSAEISEILVGIGPGSFSGIRSALSTAQGLAMGWNCPVIPIRSTHAIAWELKHISYLGVYADARRGQYFVTYYDNGNLTRPTELIPLSEVEDSLSKCTLAVAAAPLAHIPEQHPIRAQHLISYYRAHGDEPGLPLEPIYNVGTH